jgi:hypothetical protein
VLTGILAALQGSSLAAALRGSTWLYPLVNAGHIAGIALLFGAIAVHDLRLMGAWRRTPLAGLSRILIPVAAAGFAVAAITGSLLFIVKAKEYAGASLFQTKLLLIALALANVLAYHATQRRVRPALFPLFGASSLALWLAVIVVGRLIGYF